MDNYEECLYCQEIAPISDKKKLKCMIKCNGLGGTYLNSDVLEISDRDDRDEPLDDNFDKPIHESWLHMHDANKTNALSCVLTVKWLFSHVETVNIMASLLCPSSWILLLLTLQILQTD